MTKSLLLAVGLLTIFPFFAPAQSLISPEVSTDGRVTFRLNAPRAQDVRVFCETVTRSAMQRDAKGVWTLTTDPLAPDYYAYSLVVDGVHLTDPNNPLQKYNLLNTDSQVHVPGPQSLPWELNPVPHGILHQHFYHSDIAGDDRYFLVYTPPGYDPTARKRYPVLYLLHGYSDDANAWTAVGRAQVILDNLIARGQARPMILVMPLGYGTMEIVHAGWGHLQDHALWQENLDRFQGTLRQEVIPQVEKNYRVKNDRESRAIAGLSMGGTESLTTGLNHLDQFAWVGAFSSGGLDTNFPSVFAKLTRENNARLRLLWVGCGREDRLFASNQQFHEWLTSRGIQHVWNESAGNHSFLVWRRYLSQLLPLLFQTRP